MTPGDWATRLYLHVGRIGYGKEREVMAIKHRQSDPDPEKADDCPFCAKRKPRRLGLLMIEKEDPTPDAGKRCVYCRNCGACGPDATSNNDAVKLWNARTF